MRACPRCGVPGEFYANQTWACKGCIREKSREWYLANKERVAARDKAKRAAAGPRALRAKRLAFTYGMTEAQWAHLVLTQLGRCAVCGRHYGEGLVVDHCHREGEIRGLLCSKCNIGLGQFDDDPTRLVAAADYLRRAA